jgi:mono/diheme cytochrome c family protein
MRPRLLILASLGWLIVEPARAQSAADIAAGRQFATRHCSRCHGIDDERFQLTPGAPPLRDLKLLYSADDLAKLLATEMTTVHPLLPGVTFSPEQRATLQAYLDSLS